MKKYELLLTTIWLVVCAIIGVLGLVSAFRSHP
jgi:cytoskeletal protein RodZ